MVAVLRMLMVVVLKGTGRLEIKRGLVIQSKIRVVLILASSCYFLQFCHFFVDFVDFFILGDFTKNEMLKFFRAVKLEMLEWLPQRGEAHLSRVLWPGRCRAPGPLPWGGNSTTHRSRSFALVFVPLPSFPLLPSTPDGRAPPPRRRWNFSTNTQFH